MDEYVIKYLNSGLFKVRDLSDGTGLAKSTVSYYLKKPINIKRANPYNLKQLYYYFKSLNLDSNNLNQYKRVTKVQFVKE